MTLFLLIFLLIYGGLHLYMFLKAKSAFAFGAESSIVITSFMVLMIFAPILVRLLEKPGLEPVARLYAYIGYTWMGILVLFFFSSIIIDIFRLLAYLCGLIIRKDLSIITNSTTYHFLIPFFLSITITVYGYFEARNIHVEKVTIKTSKISPEIGKLKIVQISDVHLGVMVGEEKLKNILAKVKKESPDILVSTGDLVDGEMCNISGLIKLLKEINPRYGKFAITGNHEFYAGIEKALDFTKDAGFTILRDEKLTVDGLINIVGVDDPAGKPFGAHNERSEKRVALVASSSKFHLIS